MLGTQSPDEQATTLISACGPSPPRDRTHAGESERTSLFRLEDGNGNTRVHLQATVVKPHGLALVPALSRRTQCRDCPHHPSTAVLGGRGTDAAGHKPQLPDFPSGEGGYSPGALIPQRTGWESAGGRLE